MLLSKVTPWVLLQAQWRHPFTLRSSSPVTSCRRCHTRSLRLPTIFTYAPFRCAIRWKHLNCLEATSFLTSYRPRGSAPVAGLQTPPSGASLSGKTWIACPGAFP
eukprot:COSAG01_NODE_497_length_16267_cov_5.357558_3_plen_105_part_00